MSHFLLLSQRWLEKEVCEQESLSPQASTRDLSTLEQMVSLTPGLGYIIRCCLQKKVVVVGKWDAGLRMGLVDRGHEALALIPSTTKMGVVGHARNPCTREGEWGKS